MWMTQEGDHLSLGEDFAACAVGAKRSHGHVVFGRGKRFTWDATVLCGEAEHAIRRRAAQQGMEVTDFSSQAF